MPNKGFFAESTLISKAPESKKPRCGTCGIYKKCRSPKMEVTGKGKKGILIVGEAPGTNEDEQGKQFVGDSGKLLEQVLSEFNINMRRDCWLTNSLICRPPNNRNPTANEISYCRPNLTNTIAELNPTLILLFGEVAVSSLIGSLWKENPGDIGRWVGWHIPCQEINAWICPNWHPSFVLSSEGTQQGRVISLLFEKYMVEALEHSSRPWDTVPDYEKEVEVIFETGRAAAIIRKMIQKGGVVSFDYETDRLKSDHEDATITCASVCWQGRKTISFPWNEETSSAMSELLLSDVQKVGQNIKFEQRWTKRILGHGIRNWIRDDMLGMHVMDNRRGVTGLKFQVFAWLGYGSYNDHIEPFFKSKGSNEQNRINEIDKRQLLLYCGLDSLLEFKLYEVQKERGLL